MKPNLRRSFRGQFLAHSLSPRVWRLARSGPPPALEIIVHGAQFDAPLRSSLASCTQLCLEWRESDVELSIESPSGNTGITAASAIVHETQPQLYAGLPLAEFDPAARQFWQRIFRIVRIPGGRYLLGLLARRSRSSS
jgi:hypothetical protein